MLEAFVFSLNSTDAPEGIPKQINVFWVNLIGEESPAVYILFISDKSSC